MTRTLPTTVQGEVSHASGQVAIGTNINQNAIFLTVNLASGDPAQLEAVAQQVRLDPIGGRVTDWDRDFPGLFGRQREVDVVRAALATRESVAVFGEEGVGKSVLLRHLAHRVGDGFVRGVALVHGAGQRWQDIGQQVVRAFYRSSIAVYLGPAELRTVLKDLDALLLIDDADAADGIDQLHAIAISASFIIASTSRSLAGESRGVSLSAIDDAACQALIAQTLRNLGNEADVSPEVAARINRRLAGHPSRIIRVVGDAARRGLDLPALADELDQVADPAAEMVARLPVADAAIARAVAALDGAPVGPEHVAAVVAGGSKGDVDDLVDERILRVASPQVRLDPDVAVSMAKPADADAIRADYLDHFTDWARSADASDIAAESQAILYLLSWAARAGRYANARALHAATESAFAVTGRWGAWGRATQIAFEASARLGDEAAVATALNQLAIQALGVDADEKARDLLRQAQHRATDAGATFEAAVAARNLRVIDGLPPGPPIERDRGDGGGGPENGGGRIPWPRVAGVGVIALLVAGLLFVLLRPMPALGIEPAAHAFGSTAIENDSEHVSFTVTNSGGTTLEALRVALADEDEGFRVVGGDCQGRTLPSGASCVVEVVFHPGGSGEGATRLIVTASNGVSISAAIAGSAPEPTPPPPTSPPPTTPTPTPPESPTPTPSETPLPDLAIRRFTPNGIPDRAELWRVPVLVEIVNGGPGPADPFEIAITADGKPIPFVVRDEDPERLVTHEPLAAGGSLTYEGNLLLSSDTSLADVRLVVEADSCAGESSPPADCRVAEVNANQANNSLELQAVDLQLSNVVLSEWRNHEEPPDGDVDVSLDVTNGGNIDAGPFSIGVSVKGVLYPFVVGEGAADPASMLYEVDGLASGDTIHVDGIVTIPYDVLYGPLDIDVGCLAGSGQCLLPEIEHANNSDSQLIPQPVVD